MKAKRSRIKIIVLLISVMMVFLSYTSLTFAAEEEKEAFLNEQMDFMKRLILYIEANHSDVIDYKELVNGAFDGMFESLDPYSTYFSERESLDDFVESVSGEYNGIGVIIEAKENRCVIVSPIFDTPAYKAGIISGDVVVEVDEQDVTALSTEKIVSLLRGKPGTKVNVGIKREGTNDILRFEITRETIKMSSVNHEMKENGIGYIRILSFDSNTGDEFKEALTNLRKEDAKALIIDLRDNGGGYINTALEVAEEIIPEGPIMHFEKQGEITDTYYSETPQIDLPVVVLVNGGTASASEILAGAVQDTDTGIIIGTKTFGKGSAQQSTNLNNGGGMKLTVAHFMTPDKNKIHGAGITPDIMMQNNNSQELEELLEKVKLFVPMIEDKKSGLNEKGLDVYGAQQRLKLIGYSDVEATGIMDEITFNAVKHFQSAQGLYSYGIIDYTTKESLNQEVAEYAENLKEDAQLEKAIEILTK